MPTESNLLCGCGRFMRPKQNSITVEELFEDGTGYKLWDADLWACPECGAELITGFGAQPLAEHWYANYAELRERYGPLYPGRCEEDARCAGHAGSSAIRRS